MAIVHFAGSDNFEREFPDGAPLQNVIDSSKADIMFGCREGSCATCMIEVLSGRENLSPATDEEKTTLLDDELAKGIRLACQTRVLRGRISIRRADGSL